MNAARYIRTSCSSLIPRNTPKWGNKRFFSSNELQERVAIVGSGNFGSAMSTIIGRNAQELPFVHDEVKMWVHEEEIDGRKLTDIINNDNENVKYLPGFKIPSNVVAEPDLAKACKDATLLIFVLPHEFINPILGTIKRSVQPSARLRGVTMIKGMAFNPDTKRPVRISEMIEEGLGLNCGTMMGANVANEVAAGELCESTLASKFATKDMDEQTRLLLHCQESFRVRHISDVAGAEACGALKNAYALGSGFVDGIGLGGNTKAALLRVALHEIKEFCHIYFDGVQPETFTESCGMADLITTCYGGRNRKCAEEFARRKMKLRDSGTTQSSCGMLWNEIEHDLLNDQKLQGTHTLVDMYAAIESEGVLGNFPLLEKIHSIAFGSEPVESIVDGILQK